MLSIPEHLPDSEIVELLRVEIARHLKDRRDWILSKLYRLDIRESDIKQVLARADLDPATGLARLVLERHRERQASRASNEPLPEPEDPEFGDLAW